MPLATLTIAVPEDIWIGTLSRKFPEVTFQIQSARSAGGVGVALVELRGPQVEAVIDGIADEQAVTDLEVFQIDDEMALVQIEATNPFLLFPVEAAAVPLQMPFEITDGVVTWRLVTTRARLSDLGNQLDTFGIEYTVQKIQPRIDVDRVLTDKQEKILHEALDRGYYDSPRSCTLTELADDLDMAASTCSETLHRAEEHIIKRFDDEVSNERPKLEV